VSRLATQEDLNFLLTNRIPRLALTRFMGWFSKIESPSVRAASLALWRLFCDVDLTDADEPVFRSLHHAFTRRLRVGARSVDPDPALLTAPSDAIIGAFGRVRDGQVFQIKGFSYGLGDLLGDPAAAEPFRDGWFVTLRLTAGMYHRFHAPHDLEVEQVRYISGDTWNVNPIALKRIERLFCKNERAPISARLKQIDLPIVLVPVAAVLVASIRLPFLDSERNVRSAGERVTACSASFTKGQEMGWFEHGSTIVMLAPPECWPCAELKEGQVIRMGEPLLRLPLGTSASSVIPDNSRSLQNGLEP
jgi:phosphatidylserine decarboxylase